LFNKERRAREASARERENDKAACDKRPAEEIQEEVIEEIGPFSKAHKIKENISHRALVNAEGTCDNPIPTTGHYYFVTPESVRPHMYKLIIHGLFVPCDI